MNGRGRLRAALAAVAVACGAAAGPAEAARTELDGGRGASAPVLAGESVLAFQLNGTRLVRVHPDGSRSVVRDLPRPDRPHHRFRTNFAASPSHVAVARFFEVHAKGAIVAESSFRLEAGPLDGPLRELFDCEGNHVFDVDGSRIAYSADSCTDGPAGRGRIVVRDLALEGSPVVRSIEARDLSTTFPLDLAGDHVAYVIYADGPDLRLVARDLATGAEVYRTGTAGYSLQPDGKLVAGRPKDCVIDWFSRSEPFPHEIDLCPNGGMRLRADRIGALLRGRERATLMTVSLAGERRTIAAFEPSGAVGGFDYDGTRAAYVLHGCVAANNRLFVDDLTGDPAPVKGGRCPASIESRRVRASSGGAVFVRLACPRGCYGALSLRSGGDEASDHPVSFSRSGGARSYALALTRAARRELRERGSLLVQARAAVFQVDGAPRTFKRALRVLAPR
jgi:hypothetical protein